MSGKSPENTGPKTIKLKKPFDMDRFTALLYPLAFGVVFLVLWETQILHAIVGADTFILPLPSRMFTILFENLGDVLGNVAATLFVAVVGLLLGSLSGL
jgi:NitT/TauT family transport system permease protein